MCEEPTEEQPEYLRPAFWITTALAVFPFFLALLQAISATHGRLSGALAALQTVNLPGLFASATSVGLPLIGLASAGVLVTDKWFRAQERPVVGHIAVTAQQIVARYRKPAVAGALSLVLSFVIGDAEVTLWAMAVAAVILLPRGLYRRCRFDDATSDQSDTTSAVAEIVAATDAKAKKLIPYLVGAIVGIWVLSVTGNTFWAPPERLWTTESDTPTVVRVLSVDDAELTVLTEDGRLDYVPVSTFRDRANCFTWRAASLNEVAAVGEKHVYGWLSRRIEFFDDPGPVDGPKCAPGYVPPAKR